jgi:hypothetical protein
VKPLWRRRPAPALVLAVFVAAGIGCVRRPGICRICEREIRAEVRAVAVLDDGGRVTACCPRCALQFLRESGRAARTLVVSDYGGGGSLPLGAAWIVEGSDETPCLRHHPPARGDTGAPLHLCYDRCQPSLIAFRDEAAARAYLAAHGGELRPPGAVLPPGAGAAGFPGAAEPAATPPAGPEPGPAAPR